MYPFRQTGRLTHGYLQNIPPGSQCSVCTCENRGQQCTAKLLVLLQDYSCLPGLSFRLVEDYSCLLVLLQDYSLLLVPSFRLVQDYSCLLVLLQDYSLPNLPPEMGHGCTAPNTNTKLHTASLRAQSDLQLIRVCEGQSIVLAVVPLLQTVSKGVLGHSLALK